LLQTQGNYRLSFNYNYKIPILYDGNDDANVRCCHALSLNWELVHVVGLQITLTTEPQ